jgi:uncharacterized protein involved in exopolysaccharide biosynthesis
MVEYTMENRSGLMEQIQHYWHVVLKWKWISLLFFFTVVTGVTVYSFLKKPVYTATGSVWIEGESNILPFDELQTFGVGINQQSHARLLKSQTLAAEVIEELRLYENPDFVGKAAEENGSIELFREHLGFSCRKNLITGCQIQQPQSRACSRGIEHPPRRLHRHAGQETLFDLGAGNGISEHTDHHTPH